MLTLWKFWGTLLWPWRVKQAERPVKPLEGKLVGTKFEYREGKK